MQAVRCWGIIVAVLFGGAVESFAAETQLRTISVTGTATTRVAPDIVNWNIHTSDTDQVLVRAKAASDEKIRAILGLKKTMGIDADDIQTSRLNIRKVYRRDRQGNRSEFQHFVVTRSVTIKQRNLKKFDELLSRLLTDVEAEVNFSFELSKILELRESTRLNALTIAKKKADAMTKTLGAKLGKVLTIAEQLPTYPRQPIMANTMSMMRGGQAPAAADEVAGTFEPGAIEVRISAHVVFEIE